MEAKIFRDTIESAVKLCDAKAEVALETEIMIPDYLPQIFKIVKCFVEPVVLQKQPSAGRLTLEGYLRCVVFYQGEQNQKLCTTEQKMPFSKSVELPDHHANWISTVVAGEVEYLNCRAVNQRRIDVRGACILTVRCFAQEDCNAVTALAEAGMEQKLDTLDAIQQLAVTDKLITVEETVRFEQTPDSILRIDGDAVLQEVKLIHGKAVVKGEIHAKILYTTATTDIAVLEKSIPFSQILDLEGAGEDCQWAGWADVTGCTLMAGNAESGEVLSATAMLHLQVWRIAQRSIVADAFSTQCETTLEKQTFYISQPVCRLDESIEVSCTGQLPDEGAQIIACLATVCPPEILPEEKTTTLRGRVIAHIICLNSLGEMECYDRTCEYQLDKQWQVAPEQLDVAVNAVISSIHGEKDQSEAAAKMTIHLSGVVTRRVPISMVTGVECGELLEPDSNGVALRIYYAAAGEDIFAIAKNYHASPSAILQAANLEKMVLEQPVRLLIPVLS